MKHDIEYECESQLIMNNSKKESNEIFLFLVFYSKNSTRSLLDCHHHELIKRIKTLLINVQSELTILSSTDKKLLNEAQTNIDSIFLLVVVGEFNSGKSQFINTLLGEKDEICPTGVLPTTDIIQILKYGLKRENVIESDHVIEYDHLNTTFYLFDYIKVINLI